MPSVGASGSLAILIRAGLTSARRRTSVRAACFTLAAIHFALSPLSFVGNTLMQTRIARTTEAAALHAEVPPHRAGPSAAHWVFILVASDPMAGLYAGAIRALLLPGEPERGGVLSMARSPHRLTTTGASSLVIEAEQGSLLDGGFVGVFRSSRDAMQVGDAFVIPGATVHVQGVSAGAATRIEVVFDLPLHDSGQTLLVWQDGLLRQFTPPALGESRQVSWSPGPIGLF